MAKGMKTGGREPGTPNILTKEMREILKGIISKEIESIPETLKNLEPKERLELVVKLLPYVIPKMNDIDLNIKDAELYQPMIIMYNDKVLDINK